MAYEYEELVISTVYDLNSEMYPDKEIEIIKSELKDVYAKAKKLNKIIELTDVPMNIKQDKTMIEINKILNEYTEDK